MIDENVLYLFGSTLAASGIKVGFPGQKAEYRIEELWTVTKIDIFV